MKRVLSSPNPAEVSQLKSVLEDAGITCLVRNEVSAGLIGEIPVSEATPELWIENDASLDEALRLKAEWKAGPTTSGGPWVCAQCGQTSDPQFTSCWKCGAAKPVTE